MNFVTVLVVGLRWGELSFVEKTPQKPSPSIYDTVRYDAKSIKKYLASLDLCLRKSMTRKSIM